MRIKAPDTPTQIAELSTLLERDDLAPETRAWIERERSMMIRGFGGEQRAHFKLEFHLEKRRDVATIHGLRIECAGRTAQIDHLVITQYLDVWICESKAFTGTVEINGHGEWQVTYRDRSFGIDSPVAQARNHALVLSDVLQGGVVPRLILGGDVTTLRQHIAVLFSKRARIQRPEPTTEYLRAELEPVMKVERFLSRIDEQLQQRRNGADQAAISNEELAAFASRIAALHKPASVDWAARFRLPRKTSEQSTQLRLPLTTLATKVVQITTAVCGNCGVRLRPGEVQFCNDKSTRFGGRLYCMRCQAAASSSSAN